jgi:hypothetical protein
MELEREKREGNKRTKGRGERDTLSRTTAFYFRELFFVTTFR